MTSPSTWICSRCKTVYTEPRTRCSADGRRVIENMRGQTLGGRWAITRLVGVGGDGGSVWQVADAGDARGEVAIKLLPVSDVTAVQRFERGARISGMLEQRNITRVIEHGNDGAWCYLVMELLEGESLQRYLLRNQRMPPSEAIDLAEQLLEALEYTHSLQIVHRDLKPANIFLSVRPDRGLRVKLLDFGIARHITRDADDRQKSALASSDAPLRGELDEEGQGFHVTEQRQILGTPEYMAPEQIVAGHIDQRTDIYGLGVVLYRVLAGRLPFEAQTRSEMYRQHITDLAPPFPPALGVPRELAHVVLRALAKRPEDRWASATQMRAALATARAALEAHAERAEHFAESDLLTTTDSGKARTSGSPFAAVAPPRSRRSLWLGLAALIVVGVGVGVAIPLLGSPPGQASAPREVVAEARPTTTVAAPEPEAEPTPAVRAPEPEPAPVPEPAPTKVEPVPPPEPEPAPATARFTLRVRGELEADIKREGSSIGKTPMTVTFEQRELPIVLTFERAGYRAATRELTLADADAPFEVVLTRIPSRPKPTATTAEPPPPKPGTINLQR